MKKIALLLVLMILPLEMMADTVSLQRARALAEKFMAADNATRAGSLMLSYSYDVNGNVMEGTRASGDPAIYVFNRPGGGFVLVSGDDAFTPVLGYSYTGSFRDDATMPDNLRGWIEEMTGSINDLRADHAKASDKIAEQWDLYEVPTRAGSIKRATPVVLYETALWGQGDPFNRFTPAINSQQTVTGCVATSIGILMRYYKYPNRAKLNFPAASGDGYSIASRDADYDYDWENMLMSYTGSYTDAQADACARLLADIGQIGNLSYGVSSTGGVTKNVIGAMIDYYGYDKGLSFQSRYYYSDEEWLAKLKAELDVRPLNHTGRSSTGGHAFVADGYDVNDYIHINWGWTGSSNGYFTINSLGKYTSTHAAAFGFKPDADGAYTPLYAFYSGTAGSGVEYNGLELLVSAITPNQVFSVKAGGFTNRGYNTFNTEVCIAHCNASGVIKEVVNLAKMNLSTLDPGYWLGFPSVECKITKPIESGDELRAFFRVDGGEWQKVQCESTSTIHEVISLDKALSLEAASLMTYDKSAKTLTITTKPSAQISVSAESGASTAGYVTISAGSVVINLAQMPSDTYSVTMLTPTETKIFKIVR